MSVAAKDIVLEDATAAASARIDYPILLLGVFSVVYNGVLAFINHNIMPLSFMHVALFEFLILGSALLYLLTRGLYAEDLVPFGYLVFTLAMTLYLTVLNRYVYIDPLRNAMIIVCFVSLGRWINERTLKLVFRISVLIVLLFLIFEIVSTPFYVSIVHPSDYFANTRGLKPYSFNKTGLFQNALGFPGRFSFGIIDHRSSSIFLEQVSLANFCGVIAVYLIAMWERLTKRDRLLMIGTAVLILTTNDTRTMLIFSAACIVGYFIFPRLPKGLNLLIMPGILCLGLLVFTLEPNAVGDNFTGRINLTMNKLFETDVPAVLGLDTETAPQFADSGYVYLLYGTSIFGVIAFWLFSCLYPAGQTREQRRVLHSLSLFLFLNMMIGGTAIFSMKIAGLLWLCVGFMRSKEGAQAALRGRNLVSDRN